MVSFGFCLWQGGTRRPAIGDLRVMRRSEDAIQALRPSEPPPRAGGRNEEPQPPHGQGGASRPAIWTRRESQLNNFGNRKVFASRDAPTCSWDDRGSRRRVLRRAWQFLATHQPPHHPPLCFHLLLATPPRPPAAVRQGPTRDAPATARPPVLPAGASPLTAHSGAHAHVVVEKRRARACRSGASSGDECMSLVPVAHADVLM